MGFASKYRRVERLDLGDGYWVEVRAFLSHDQQAAAGRCLFRQEMNEAGKQTTVTDQPGYNLERAAQAVVTWNLDDDNGQPLPTSTPDEVRAGLRLPGCGFLVTQINQFLNDQERGVTEQASFPGPGSGSPEGREPATP